MKIAILGATSEIAKDLILSFAAREEHDLLLFARRPEVLIKWLSDNNLSNQYLVFDLESFKKASKLEAILNFIGAGNPTKIKEMGPDILDLTGYFDQMALDYQRLNPRCRYIFMSSGAAYGLNFDGPVVEQSHSIVNINNVQIKDFYVMAKIYAEYQHRSRSNFPIVDIRIFNYFSHTQNMNARFLISDVVRAIQNKTTLQTSKEFIIRDYLHPSDFYRLVNAILSAPPFNAAMDCFSKAPVDKVNLLTTLHDKFGLQYEFRTADSSTSPTEIKPFYYSNNKSAQKIGYKPQLTSLEGVITEISTYFKDIDLNLSSNQSSE